MVPPLSFDCKRSTPRGLQLVILAHTPWQAQLSCLEQFADDGDPLKQTGVSGQGSSQLFDATQLNDCARDSCDIQRHTLVKGRVVGGALLHTLQHLQQRVEAIP